MQFPPLCGTGPLAVDVMTVGYPVVHWPQKDGPLEVVLPDIETHVFRLKSLGPLSHALERVGASKSHLDALAAGSNVQLVDDSSPVEENSDEEASHLIVTAAPYIDREALVVSVVHGLPEVRSTSSEVLLRQASSFIHHHHTSSNIIMLHFIFFMLFSC